MAMPSEQFLNTELVAKHMQQAVALIVKNGAEHVRIRDQGAMRARWIR